MVNFDWLTEIQERGGCLYCLESGFEGEGTKCRACYGTGKNPVENGCWTIGACCVYDKDEVRYKGEGGSVWRHREDVISYFESIGGQVSLMNRQVEAAIYEVRTPNNWDKDTDSIEDVETKSWKRLNKKALIIRKVT